MNRRWVTDRARVFGCVMGAVLLTACGLAAPRASADGSGRAGLAAVAGVRPPYLELRLGGDGDDADAVTGLAVGADGSLYACGTLWGAATGYDIVVTRLAPAGWRWTRSWSSAGRGDDGAADIAVAADGAVYVTGRQEDGSILLKYSAEGELQWQTTRAWGLAHSLGLDDAGNVYVGGREDNEDSGGTRATLERYTPDGRLLWSRTYQVPGYKTQTWVADMCVRAGGRTYLVGAADGVDFVRKAWVASWQADGTRRWSRLYDGPGTAARFAALAPCPAGGIYAVGRVRSDADDILLARYRADGARALTRRLGVGDGRRQWADDVAVGPTGDIYLAGAWQRTDRAFYVARLSRAGCLVWSRTYAGDLRHGYARTAAVDAAGKLYVAGNGRGATSGGVYAAGPIVTRAFSAAGVPRWSCSWSEADATSSAAGALDVLDMATWRSARVWVGGSTDARPAGGVDGLILGWSLDGSR